MWNLNFDISFFYINQGAAERRNLELKFFLNFQFDALQSFSHFSYECIVTLICFYLVLSNQEGIITLNAGIVTSNYPYFQSTYLEKTLLSMKGE